MDQSAKCLGVLLLVLLASLQQAFAASIVDTEYTVPAGKVSQIPVGNSAMLVQRFVMGDGSQVQISDQTSLFVIHAKQAIIGNNTAIVGQATHGQNGPTAEPGEPGSDGPTIVLIFEQQDIQGLSVVALGGDGGKGGQGQPGTRGREASCTGPGAGNGGNGGPGGNGGNSGNGGNIFLVLPKDTGGYGISLNVNFGVPGVGGPGGVAGAGGPGRHRCGPWPYWSRGAGSPGAPGPQGQTGTVGARGLFRTFHIDDFRPAAITNQLEDIVALLANRGFAGDAEALRAVLEAGVLK